MSPPTHKLKNFHVSDSPSSTTSSPTTASSVDSEQRAFYDTYMWDTYKQFPPPFIPPGIISQLWLSQPDVLKSWTASGGTQPDPSDVLPLEKVRFITLIRTVNEALRAVSTATEDDNVEDIVSFARDLPKYVRALDAIRDLSPRSEEVAALVIAELLFILQTLVEVETADVTAHQRLQGMWVDILRKIKSLDHDAYPGRDASIKAIITELRSRGEAEYLRLFREIMRSGPSDEEEEEESEDSEESDED